MRREREDDRECRNKVRTKGERGEKMFSVHCRGGGGDSLSKYGAHARILANAEIYGRSLNFFFFV